MTTLLLAAVSSITPWTELGNSFMALLLMLPILAMASGVTNRGKYNILAAVFRAATLVSNYYIALFTSATTPNADINTKSELTEIANGTGYTTGGISIALNSTDWDTLTEDDGNDRALIQLKNIVWTASGGPVPTSGSGARWACLTDDNATQGSREVWVWWDLASDRTVSDTQTLTLVDCEIRLS